MRTYPQLLTSDPAVTHTSDAVCRSAELAARGLRRVVDTAAAAAAAAGWRRGSTAEQTPAPWTRAAAGLIDAREVGAEGAAVEHVGAAAAAGVHGARIMCERARAGVK